MRKLRQAIQLLLRAFKGYWAKLSLILFLSVISAASEGIGISAIVPAFAFVAGGGTPVDVVSLLIRDFFLYFGLPYSFRMVLLLIAALFVVRTIMLFLVQIVTARIAYGFERNTRTRLFALTAAAGWPYLSKQKVGHLNQLLMQNASVSTGLFINFSVITVIATKTLAYLAVAVNVAPFVALFAVGAGAVALVLFRPLFAKGRAYSADSEQAGRGVSHFVNQHTAGMKTIKVMGLEQPVVSEATHYFNRLRHNAVMAFTIRGMLQMLVALGGLLFVGIAFAVMYKLPGFQVATFGIVVYAINQIFTQVQLIQGQIQTIGSIVPYLRALSSYEDEVAKEKETLEPGASPAFNKEIAFENVSFSYPERGVTLTDVTFTIPHGSMVGVIGPSGSGKTTVVDLLLRLYEPSKGRILVDGKPLALMSLMAWRKSVGYVTQDVFLLNATVAENIAFYMPMPRKTIIEAAKAANLHDFIESLPKGYDTIVGDRGVLVSGGQRQRVVLARALARKPRLLVLDEATSALDTESERAIQETIEGLRGKVTTFIIAHRLSTVVGADHIVALDKGTVIESGAPDRLLADPNSYFARMTQMG